MDDEPFHGPENQREVQVPIKRQEFTAAATVEKFSLVTMNSFSRIFQARELDYLLQRLITVTWIKMYMYSGKKYTGIFKHSSEKTGTNYFMDTYSIT